MRTIVPAAALALASLFPALAQADTLHFVFTATSNPGAGDFSFDLPSSPVPVYVSQGGTSAETEVISIQAGGKTFLSTTTWYNNGFSFDSGDFSLSGATPFTGSVEQPKFLPNSFSLTEFDPAGRDAGVLVISQVTPEPSSVWLLATGAMGLCAGLRRRPA